MKKVSLSQKVFEFIKNKFCFIHVLFYIVENLEKTVAVAQLTETQIQLLINHLNANDCNTSNQQDSSLALHLDQFIEICHRQKIDTNNLTITSQPTLTDKFSLTPSQIADLIQQNNFDVKKLKIIEKQLKTQRFYLNPSQLAYLFVHRRPTYSKTIEGLSASQLVALYMLQQPKRFSLTYEQIKQIALQQSK